MGRNRARGSGCGPVRAFRSHRLLPLPLPFHYRNSLPDLRNDTQLPACRPWPVLRSLRPESAGGDVLHLYNPLCGVCFCGYSLPHSASPAAACACRDAPGPAPGPAKYSAPELDLSLLPWHIELVSRLRSSLYISASYRRRWQGGPTMEYREYSEEAQHRQRR